MLTTGQREEALRLVHEVFDMFTVKNDHLLAYARRVTSTGNVPSPAAILRGAAVETADRTADRAVDGMDDPVDDTSPSTDHRPMADLVRDRMERFRAHPFPAWISGGEGAPADRLAAFLPLWVPDIMGYADLMTYALTFPEPSTRQERALNRKARLLASHHRLFAHDAAALDLDARLGWTAGESLRFLGLGQETDLQRESMAAFLDAAYRHRSPVVRFWMLKALQGSGETFFRHGGRLARTVENRDGVRLDYLADRHMLTHPQLDPDPDADAVVFTQLPVTVDEQEIALGIITVVFDQLEKQFDQSLRILAAPSTDRRGQVAWPSGLSAAAAPG